MTVDIFKDKEMLDHLNDEIPLVVSMISEVRDYECEVFLPEPVNNLLKDLSLSAHPAQVFNCEANIEFYRGSSHTTINDGC